ADLIPGNLDYYWRLAVGAIPLIANKQLRVLAILTPERSPLLPDLPTAREQGVDAIDGYYWMGFFFPKGVPEPIVAKLNAAISAALDTPAVQARLREVATTVVANDRRAAAYLQKYVESEITKWAAAMKGTGGSPH